MIAIDNERESVISVLVAESCAMNCELMATALERDRSGLTVVASVTDINDVLSSYLAVSPDVCIVGANLKDGVSSGFKATQDLRNQFPGARVILLLDMEQNQAVVDAFRAGAAAFFPVRSRSKFSSSAFSGCTRASSGLAIGKFNIWSILSRTFLLPSRMQEARNCLRSGNRDSFILLPKVGQIRKSRAS